VSYIRKFPGYIGVKPKGYSRRLERAMADFGSEESFEMGSRRIKEHYGIEVPKSAVREVTLKHAKRVSKAEEEQPKVRTLSGSGKPMIESMMDGSMVRMVKTGTKTGDKRKGIEIYWEEAKLEASCAHESLEKHYAVTFEGPTEAGEKLARVTKKAGWGTQSKIHGVGDGAPWIATQFRLQFDKQATFLLDFYHVCEYLWAVAEECLGANKQWFNLQKQRLKTGKIELVMSALKKLAKPDNAAETAYNYLDNRRDQLFYKESLKAGLSIGSGMIEGGHKHVLQKRLKRPGTRWLGINGHSMADMLVLRANNEWDLYWGSLKKAA